MAWDRDKILAKVYKNIAIKDRCVIWTGRHNPDGSGRITQGHQSRPANVAIFEYVICRELPEGYQLKPMCHNPDCILPLHQELIKFPTTKKCFNGHSLTQENTYISPAGRKQCRKCAVINVTNWRQRHKPRPETLAA